MDGGGTQSAKTVVEISRANEGSRETERIAASLPWRRVCRFAFEGRVAESVQRRLDKLKTGNKSAKSAATDRRKGLNPHG